MSKSPAKHLDFALQGEELGICETIDEAGEKAKKAFEIYRDVPFSLRKKIIANIRAALSEHAEFLAKMAVEETGLGRVEDKIAKNRLVIEKTPGIEGRDYKPNSAYLGDYGVTFLNGAPFGVIGSITPSTNPAATIINNSISMLSAGNIVVFNTHPGAKNVSNTAAMLVNKAILDVGCKTRLVFSVKDPTIESSQQLMKHPCVKLLVVTGGPDVVRTAMASGKRVIAAGPGNPPVIVDETAEIDEAAEYIVKGASFENNILCVAEKEVFVVDEVAYRLKYAMAKLKAYELNPDQIRRVTNMVFIEKDGNKVVNKKYVGKDACIIAADAGIDVPEGTRLLFGETEFEHPLVQHEQLMPVLPIVKVENWEQAMEDALEAEHGNHHTLILHSTNIERLIVVAKRVNTALFVENGHSLSALGYEGEGYTTMTIAGHTGEGVTGPWTFVRERRFVMRDSFRGAIGSLPHG
jgi:acyl-CoA reductase-like NAD-dependent aldehyde dehydrogenase